MEEDSTYTEEQSKPSFRIPTLQEVESDRSKVQLPQLWKSRSDKTTPSTTDNKPNDKIQSPPISSSFVRISTDQSTPQISSSYFNTTSTNAPVITSQQSSTSNAPLSQTSTPNVNNVIKKGTNNMIISNSQKGNHVLKYIKSVGWEFGNIIPDYVMGASMCALFLSLRYHLLHSDYIQKRMNQVGKSFKSKFLMCLVDIDDNRKVLQDIILVAHSCGFTVIVSWSNAEVARYLETFKMYEHKAPDVIKERAKEDLFGKVSDTLTSIRSVNRTDVENLLINFGNVKSIMGANVEELSLCPGLGERKVKRLYAAFRQPFITHNVKKQSKITTTLSKIKKKEVMDDEIDNPTFSLNSKKQRKGKEEDDVHSNSDSENEIIQ